MAEHEYPNMVDGDRGRDLLWAFGLESKSVTRAEVILAPGCIPMLRVDLIPSSDQLAEFGRALTRIAKEPKAEAEP